MVSKHPPLGTPLPKLPKNQFVQCLDASTTMGPHWAHLTRALWKHSHVISKTFGGWIQQTTRVPWLPSYRGYCTDKGGRTGCTGKRTGRSRGGQYHPRHLFEVCKHCPEACSYQEAADHPQALIASGVKMESSLCLYRDERHAAASAGPNAPYPQVVRCSPHENALSCMSPNQKTPHVVFWLLFTVKNKLKTPISSGITSFMCFLAEYARKGLIRAY